jgi:hypothetical protein
MASMRECVCVAALGGLLPTAARLATAFVGDPQTPVPGTGLFIGLALFAVIGAVLAYAFSETNVRQALILGIAAPGVITNIVSGAGEARANRVSSLLLQSIPIGSVHAQPQPAASSPALLPRIGTSSVDQRTLTVLPRTRNSDAWSDENLPVAVTFIQGDGTDAGSTTIVPIGQKQRVPIPAMAKSVRFTAGTISRVESLSRLPETEVAVEVTVNGKNDFLWALGARRQAIVSNVKIVASPGQ